MSCSGTVDTINAREIALNEGPEGCVKDGEDEQTILL